METIIFSMILEIWDSLLDLPIRDGNNMAGDPWNLSIRLLDLPIRDGNEEILDLADHDLCLLDLPIRDGNGRPPLVCSPVSMTFRPSYQGWKHGGLQMSEANVTSF